MCDVKHHVLDPSQSDPSRFVIVETFGDDEDDLGIIEHEHGGLEPDTVLCVIGSTLLTIPLKQHVVVTCA